jgi:hypothetical protein
VPTCRAILGNRRGLDGAVSWKTETGGLVTERAHPLCGEGLFLGRTLSPPLQLTHQVVDRRISQNAVPVGRVAAVAGVELPQKASHPQLTKAHSRPAKREIPAASRVAINRRTNNISTSMRNCRVSSTRWDFTLYGMLRSHDPK